ncbi:hypothetical protein Q3G72_022907 [Acer saccharum]|nr:hypothetical protein Q3G72_022907 [Acer saccharum]
MEVFETIWPFLRKKGSFEGLCKHDRDRAEGSEKGVGKSNDRMDCIKEVREFSCSSKMARKEPKVAEAVKIDKKRIASTMSNLEDSDSTDLGSSSDFGPGPNQMFLRGECSKRRSEERKSASGPGDGPHMLDNNKVLKCGKKAGMENRADQINGVAQISDSYVRISPSIQEVPETQFTNNQGIDIIVDLRDRGMEKDDHAGGREETSEKVMSKKEEEDCRQPRHQQNSATNIARVHPETVQAPAHAHFTVAYTATKAIVLVLDAGEGQTPSVPQHFFTSPKPNQDDFDS